MLLLLLLLKDRELVVLLLDSTLSIHKPLAKSLVLVGLNHLRGGQNVCVIRALRKLRVLNCHQLVQRLVELYPFPHIHGLVVFIDLVRVAESRVNLLLDDGFHTVGELVAMGIQKVCLSCHLLLGESAHRNQLLNKPLVCFAQLAQFHIDCSFVDNVDYKLA